jgi:hypothetical protein
MTIPTKPYTQVQEHMTYVNIELAWAPFKHDIPAKSAQGEMGEWLMDNVGQMGICRASLDEWKYMHPSWRWAWSLSSGKFQLPLGVYFLHPIDATRFALTFPLITRMTGRHCE